MTSRATLGEVRIAGCEVCTNQGFKSLVPFIGIDNFFLFYQIALNKEQYKGLGIGSTFLEVNKRDTEKFEVLIAPLPQQRRIAEILSTLDEAIEQTEALIAKMQQVKAGLMHDLFTRGVTPDGRLRPTREQAPGLYKESPIGWIPREWEVKPCSAICEKITVGIVVRPTQYYVSEGVPAFRSANIREDGIDPSDFVFISPQSNALLAKSQVQAGDVISVRTGYPGTSAVVPEEFSGANCVDILITRPGSSVRPSYLTNWINSSFGKDQVLRKQGGLAQQHFNVGELRNLLVALPDISEQDAIIERMVAVSERIAEEQTLAEKRRLQKNGLMHDLLTGRVSVPVGNAKRYFDQCTCDL
jgi:type I restriction enzyme S subunit